MCGLTPFAGRPAVFLDRDGTLIEDRGHLRSPDEVRFFPDTIPALRRLAVEFELFIVTHQGGVGMGLVTPAEVEAVHRHLLDRLAAEGIVIRAVYTCPHRRDEGCDCIKPNPRHLHEAAGRFNLDLHRSFVVGDHPHDVELANRAGATGLYVRTGHGQKHLAEVPRGVIVLPGIREAADWMLADIDMHRRLGDPDRALDRAAELLQNGGVVAFPTETVYGLGAHALDERAVARIFEIKGRPHFDPLIVHVSGPDAARELAGEIPAIAARLMDRFWPGPLTLVLPKKPGVPDLVTSGLPTVGLRCPRHPVAWALLRRSGLPLAAPSANRFGRTSPTTAADVAEQLGTAPDLILDGGACPVGIESTILGFEGETPVLLRPGGLPLEEIEAEVGPVRLAPATDDRPQAPGRLLRHYAPRTPLTLWTGAPTGAEAAASGLLAFRAPPPGAAFAAVEVLSESGDLREAAARLFGAIHRLDGLGLKRIYAEGAPDTGLGRAINDRLRRAAAAGE
jgi:L-threonylcarbamoyladenylate synthase